MGFCRCLDYLFGVFLLMSIPITILIDAQTILPASWYPQQLLDLCKWYCTEFKDPLFSTKPVWFLSFVACELLFQMPFSFVAAHAFFTGTFNRIQLPLVVYSVHLVTAVFAILCHVAFADFKDAPEPRLKTVEDRVKLSMIYLPYLIFPTLIYFRTTMSSSEVYEIDDGESYKSPQGRRVKKKQY